MGCFQKEFEVKGVASLNTQNERKTAKLIPSQQKHLNMCLKLILVCCWSKPEGGAWNFKGPELCLANQNQRWLNEPLEWVMWLETLG